MNFAQLEAYASDLINAVIVDAEAIATGVASAAPYIAKVVALVRSGGVPSDADWADLKARLDAGTADLDSEAAKPDPAP